MAAIVESFTVQEEASVTTSSTITKPTGTVDGDLLLFFGSADNPAQFNSEPSGLTTIYNNTAGSKAARAWYKAASSEPADYTFGLDVAQQIVLGAIRISGHDAADPIDVSGHEQEESADSTPEFTGLTLTNSDTLCVWAYHDNLAGIDGSDTGYPSGTTGLFARQAGTEALLALCHETVASSGATGQRVWTWPNAGRLPIMGGVAINTGAGGVAVAPPAGSLDLTGLIPAINTGKSIASPAGSWALTGIVPGVATVSNVIVLPPAGTLSWAGLAPGISAGVNVAIPAGSIALAGFIPTIRIAIGQNITSSQDLNEPVDGSFPLEETQFIVPQVLIVKNE